METVAFYSYKGGVGRSLLLANTARFLAALGKSVVALDLDLEAPGLHYKLGGSFGLKHRSVKEIKNDSVARKGGVVPYLLAAVKGSGSVPKLSNHFLFVPAPPESGGRLFLVPAGPAPSPAYWQALKELGDHGPMSDTSGGGVMVLLDLQARIAEELKPDYLLIDARTGVTELGGLTTTVLADTVVCLFVSNQESLDGTLAVVEALKAAPRLKGQGPVRVVPVVSRLAEEKLSGDERFTAGVKRLLELGEGRVSGQQKVPELFTLPHDQALARGERVVGGEQKASLFSPLYKSYLDLYQHLFPGSAEPARQVLERLEAVAEIKEALVSPKHWRYGFGEDLKPWEFSAIREGVSYAAEQPRGVGSRYADLVCVDDSGRPVMAVEYLGDGSDRSAAEKFWAEQSRLRCVLLLSRTQHGLVRDVLTRPADRGELRDTGRWDPPLPKEFELLADVGDRSVEPMLDALRRGHVEAVAWLINAWQEVSSARWSDHPHRRPRFEGQEGDARRILDGLAATEDLRCAEEILRRSSQENEHRGDPRRWFRDDMSPWSEEELAEQTARELLAPLFWRLPIEVLPSHTEARRHPGDRPNLAGYRLLAHDLMGLSFDPERSARAEAQALARRSLRRADEDDPEDRHTLGWAYRRRRELERNPHLSDDLPPAIIWDAVLAKDRWFQGSLEEARAKLGEAEAERLVSAANLRRRLKALSGVKELPVQGLLGSYDASGRVGLYVKAVTATAEVLGVSPRFLKSAVFIHLSTWALAHQALDLDGQPGYGFVPAPVTSPFVRESPSHVALVQAFTHRLILKLGDTNLLAAFEKLSRHQPEPYRRWEAMQGLPLERLRQLLLRARASASAIGVPGASEPQ